MNNRIIKPEELRIGNKIKGNVVYKGDAKTFERFNEKLTVVFFSDGSIHGIGEFLKDCEGIPLTTEWLERMGFEKKPVYGWKGNGYDYQPETSKTECQDYVIDAGDEDYFFVRYETWSYRKDEESEWSSETSTSFHKGSWYEKAQESIPCQSIQYLHQLQNLFYALTGTEFNLDHHRAETDQTK